MLKSRNAAKPLSSISRIPLWLSPLNRPDTLTTRESEKDESDPPPPQTGGFPLALHRGGSVLAVKGSLRRFAPWTAPGRSERRAAYEGKGGVGPGSAERGG